MSLQGAEELPLQPLLFVDGVRVAGVVSVERGVAGVARVDAVRLDRAQPRACREREDLREEVVVPSGREAGVAAPRRPLGGHAARQRDQVVPPHLPGQTDCVIVTIT